MNTFEEDKEDRKCFTFLFSPFCSHSYIGSALKGVAVRKRGERATIYVGNMATREENQKFLHSGNSKISKVC